MKGENKEVEVEEIRSDRSCSSKLSQINASVHLHHQHVKKDADDAIT
jgi:hypothetical protein